MARAHREAATRIKKLLERHPALAERLTRKLLTILHNKGLAPIDKVYDEARQLGGRAPVVRKEEDPNIASSAPWEEEEQDAIQEVTLRYASVYLSWEEVEGALNSVRRREEAESLESIANLPDVPFKLLAERVRRFCALPRGDERMAPSEVTGIRVALVRNFISDQMEFIGVAKNYLRVRDFDWLLDRVIGPDRGQGRIGGKAAGMFLGYRILQGAEREHREDPLAKVNLPESWFMRSDVIHTFLHDGGLDEYQNQKYKDPEEIRNEYPLVRQVFQNAEFQPEIVSKLGRLLDEVGKHSLIVRSSSLLEDRFGAAFSGMYASIFLGNQGPKKERLRALLGAIKEVYASTLGPDPLLYRRRHNLVDYNEEMAILIQKVVGRRHGKFFLPDLGGMAFSRNEYRWSPKIRPEDGMARVVLGLGTRAVDRTANDYPRMIALGAPLVRPEVTPQEVIRYSQKLVDVIDLQEDRFRSVPIDELLAEGPDVPGLELAGASCVDGTIMDPAGSVGTVPPENLCLTFDRMVSRTPFAAQAHERLRRLEDAYGVPINLEFAQVGDEFYLLQCRPLIQIETERPNQIPVDVEDAKKIFSARGVVRSGELRELEYMVYVNPWEYDTIDSLEKRQALGRAVGRINDALESPGYVLMGPGRWGSNDSRLGVRVSYSHINHCRLLIEIALQKGGFVPEVSYGTHFFQDLVEDGIFYLALYPDEQGTVFNETFFRDAPNSLASLVPRDAGLGRYIKVIRMSDAVPGNSLRLVMDGNEGEALCWLE